MDFLEKSERDSKTKLEKNETQIKQMLCNADKTDFLMLIIKKETR